VNGDAESERGGKAFLREYPMLKHTKHNEEHMSMNQIWGVNGLIQEGKLMHDDAWLRL